MNILYISHISMTSQWTGPSHSVPAQIIAQKKYDNVFWYNEKKNINEEWKAFGIYHDLNDYPNGKIADLPEPFNHPDIVVVEQFYNMAKSKMLYELINGDIPYIIIPRGELTYLAQKRKMLKKRIFNSLVFKRFARKALAIEYLTEQEKLDSGNKWNDNSVVIPNGVKLPKMKKNKFSDSSIKCVIIGRLEPYQKGLDLLIEACSEIKEELLSARCTIDIYGPDRVGKKSELELHIKEKELENNIFIHEGIYGKDKETVLLESDVYLMPSRFEGHPMALIEAMAYGLPCVVTKGSNMRNEIEAAGVGWGADNDKNDIKNAMLEMLKNSDKFYDMSKNAIALARQYNWEKIANKTHEIYESLLR